MIKFNRIPQIIKSKDKEEFYLGQRTISFSFNDDFNEYIHIEVIYGVPRITAYKLPQFDIEHYVEVPKEIKSYPSGIEMYENASAK